MRNRVFRPIAAILSIMLLTNVPAQAGPVVISQVVQVLSAYQDPPEIKLRGVSQNSTDLASGLKGSEYSDTLIAPVVSGDASLLSGLEVTQDPRPTIDVIDQGDIEGTVCDCGEIILAGGGWPKWPLLFLAAIPFFFIHDDCDDCDEPFPTPTPTPPSAPPPGNIPEPASLLLFATGLAAFGAGLRRRHAKNKLSEQINKTKGK